ncbi:Glucan endo-1,3-beta-glucosidase [Linum grandiflorum]
MAECKEIQEEGACFHPNNLVSHASYAFNSYYQQNGNSDIACNFGGAASLTKHDPSTCILIQWCSFCFLECLCLCVVI